MPDEFTRPSGPLTCLKDVQGSLYLSNLKSVISVSSWSESDDKRLLEQVSRLGENRWSLIGRKIGRASSQCFERYFSHLRPKMPVHMVRSGIPSTTELVTPGARLSRQGWTDKEDSALLNLYRLYGPNWNAISRSLFTITCARRQRTSSEVQLRYEHILQSTLPFRSLGDKENRTPNNTVLRNSLLSWSGASRRKSKPDLITSPSADTLNSSKRLRLWCGTDITASGLKTSISDSSRSRKAPSPEVSHGAPISVPLITQLSVPKASSPDRLTISLPCLSENRFCQHSTQPVLQSSSTLQSLLLRKQFETTKTHLLSTALRTSSIVPNISNPPVDNTAHRDLADCRIKPEASPHPVNSLNTVGVPGCHTEDHFFVQTPTKALSEADQLSFHLASPPAVLRNLVSGSSTARYVGFTQKPDSRRTPNRMRHLLCNSTTVNARSVCARLFEAPLSADSRTTCATLEKLAERSLFSSARINDLAISATLSSTGINDANCLAVLTAKATAWNRAITPTSTPVPSTISDTNFNASPVGAASIHGQFGGWTPVVNPKVQSGCDPDYSGTYRESFLIPLAPLKVPPRMQPQLSTRRVVQIGYEDQWRRFALGTSDTHRSTTRLARQFLRDLKSVSASSSPSWKSKCCESVPPTNLFPVKPEPPDDRSLSL
ncbi:hypothetical protein PHET_01209 [Paragonimus heterotremus]|uniref:Uncharacterized protein n=1 Tax=Paragonimus heterotremus TaxID=100268 RepID=A0A8J4SSN6_9TREM|nr:hypothetical protein PHET_01209 [Paragonimus heterotremus]